MVIYLDAAATMPVIDGVTTRIAENLESRWGSVSGAHQVSLSAKNLLEEARERIAESLDVAPDSIVFTSGATEALNLVIQGFGRAHPDARIFYSSIEHAAVKEAAEYRKSHGHNIETLSVDNSGQLLLDQLDDISEGDLVCVMPVNNEVGVVNDVEAIAEKVHERGGYLLLDCVQSFYAYEPATMCEIADFVVYSGHKLGGTTRRRNVGGKEPKTSRSFEFWRTSRVGIASRYNSGILGRRVCFCFY
jgi:cysteine desulfurase